MLAVYLSILALQVSVTGLLNLRIVRSIHHSCTLQDTNNLNENNHTTIDTKEKKAKDNLLKKIIYVKFLKIP